jgi:hypothetical protein
MILTLEMFCNKVNDVNFMKAKYENLSSDVFKSILGGDGSMHRQCAFRRVCQHGWRRWREIAARLTW